MTTRSTMTLRGDRNQCPACGQLFNSTHAFELHRTGEHAGNQRRCLTPDEMHAKGMRTVAGGWWVSRLRLDPEAPASVDCYDDPPGSEPVRRRLA